MARRTTLNAKNLEALGASRLAELLIELSTGSAVTKRRLRLELSGTAGTEDVVQEIRKRLTTLARARGAVGWQKRAALVRDLEDQRRAIVEQVAAHDPAAALTLMWQFLALASATLERSNDTSGSVMAVFAGAVTDLAAIASAAKPDPTTLADAMYQALTRNDHGLFNTLIAELAPILGSEGLEHLKTRMTAELDRPATRPGAEKRRVVGQGLSGPVFDDGVKDLSRLSAVRRALMDIADAQGDVDAFITQHSEQIRLTPLVAAEIARRLLAAGRAREAWQVLEAAKPRARPKGRDDDLEVEWEDACIEVLEALGDPMAAQAARWSCFERALSAEHLRAYLRRLPDFDDVEAEERALNQVEAHPDPLRALAFLVSWPALERAARVVIRRVGQLDGDDYEVLGAAADALAGRHPLAATLALRAMIDFALGRNRASRYKHAARHLLECESLESAVTDWGTVEPHAAYAARLRGQHGRKRGFWNLLR